MAQHFVPLASGTPLKGLADAATTARTAAEAGFEARVKGVPTPDSAVSGGAPDGGAHLPKISLQKEGDRVTRIQITCSCGQVIEIECVY